MAVFYNSETGQYDVESQSLNPITESAFLANEARLHTGTGWHEYSSVAAMNAAVAANHWPAPTQNNNPVTAAGKQAAGTATHAAQQATNLTGLAAIGDFFSRITEANTWIRLVKVVVGGVLVIAGLVHMTGAGGKAAQIVRKMPLPGV